MEWSGELIRRGPGRASQASKVDGKYPYNVATVPLLAETTKLVLSSVLLYRAR